jgi:hypothetical protein
LKIAPITVVLPSYNHAAYLRRSLPAILGQTVAPSHVVVVDDGSEDDTPALLARLAAMYPSLSVLRNPENRGVEASMARGLAACTTPYFCAVSATDELRPTFLERMLPWVERHPDCGLYLSDFAFRPHGSERLFPKHIGLAPRASYIGPEQLCRVLSRAGYILPAHGCVFRTEAVRRAGGFDARLRWHADWFTELVIGFRHGICYVPEPLAIADVARGNYSSGATRAAEQAEVLAHLLTLIEAPRYADVAPLLLASGALAYFGTDILRVARAGHPRAAPTRLPRASLLWRSARGHVVRGLPLWARTLLWRARYALLHPPRHRKLAALSGLWTGDACATPRPQRIVRQEPEAAARSDPRP